MGRVSYFKRLVLFLVALLVVHGGAQADSRADYLLISAKIGRKLAQDAMVRQAALVLASGATIDTDGFPLTGAPASGGGPADGGLVPTASGAPRGDAYGAMFGYCAWDNGTSTSAAGHLPGLVSFAAPVLAVIGPGPDGVIQTTCARIFAGSGASGDDYVVTYTSGEILGGGLAGRTSAYFADPVLNVASLSALPATSVQAGQVRLVTSGNQFYRYDGAAWTALTASQVDWGTLTNKPTTVAGLGLTDGVSSAIQISAGSGLAGGGDLSQSRTLSLSSSGVSAGTYGSATAIPTFTVDGYGRITSAGSVSLTWGNLAGKPTTVAGLGLTDGVSSSTQIVAGGGLIGGGDLSQSRTISLPTTGVSAGSYGSSTVIPTFTVDAYGRITSVSTVTVSTTAPVTSVFGRTGAVVLLSADVTGALGYDPLVQIKQRVGQGGNAIMGALPSDSSGSSTPTNLGIANGYTGALASVTESYAAGSYGANNGAGMYNVGIGVGAGYKTTTGNGNILLGYQTGYSNTTGGFNVYIGTLAGGGSSQTTSSENVFVGWYSGWNTSGGRNLFLGGYSGAGFGGTNQSVASVYLGYSTGEYNTSGAYNTFVGAYAGQNNTTGSSNNFFGYTAGNANTTGGSNDAFGYYAGSSITTGSNNALFGFESGFSLQTTSYNAFFGPASGIYATGSNNVLIGYNAGAGTSGNKNTASGNVYIGYTAGQANTSGNGNVYVGYAAGSAATTATYDTFVGYGAGQNTTGSYNTFYGYMSGAGVTTSQYNTAVGVSSLASLGASADTALGHWAGQYASGSNSVFVGANAGAGLSGVPNAGVGNVFVGRYAGTVNSSGGSNTFIGNNSGIVNWSGSTNGFFGANSGYSNTTGSNNNFIGASSGYSNTTGSGNTALGASALYAVTTNGNNSAFGYGAAQLATGAGNVFVGYSAGSGASNSGSNNIAIGYQAGSGITTGGYNVFMGYNIGGGTTSGSVVLGNYTGAISARQIILAANDVPGTNGSNIAGSFLYNATPTAGNGWVFYNSNYGGSCNYVSGTSWTCSSDRRLKENISTISPDSVLARFMAVRPVTYNLIGSPDRATGFIAQELIQQFPDMVHMGANGYYGVTYTDMIAVITSVVQAQQRNLDALMSRVMVRDKSSTVLTGMGDAPVMVQSDAGVTIAKFNKDGSFELPVEAAKLVFSAAQLAVSADSASGDLVVSSSRQRTALRLEGGAAASQRAVYGYLFGDAQGVGLSDGAGKVLLKALTKQNRGEVSVNGDLAIGDSQGGQITFGSGQSIAAGADGFVGIQGSGLRVYDPISKQAVISLGSDGTVEAKRFKATDVVQEGASCTGQDGAIARDASGALMACGQ